MLRCERRTSDHLSRAQITGFTTPALHTAPSPSSSSASSHIYTLSAQYQAGACAVTVPRLQSLHARETVLSRLRHSLRQMRSLGRPFASLMLASTLCACLLVLLLLPSTTHAQSKHLRGIRKRGTPLTSHCLSPAAASLRRSTASPTAPLPCLSRHRPVHWRHVQLLRRQRHVQCGARERRLLRLRRQ